MHIRKVIFTAGCFWTVLVSSCAHTENNKLIIGHWQGIEWLENGKPSELNASGTAFNFTDKGTYRFDYGSNRENGTYKVENDMLFTTPENQTEIMVKIAKLTPDSLVFEMNRSGGQERLTLLRR